MIYKVFAENQSEVYFDHPFTVFWIKSSILEMLWSKDQDYLPPGEQDYFKSTYFCYTDLDGNDLEEPIFYCGRAYLSEEYGIKKIRFSGGMHRTRWMLDLGIDLIPLGLISDSISVDDIVFGLAKKGSLMELPVSISDIKAEKFEYDNM